MDDPRLIEEITDRVPLAFLVGGLLVLVSRQVDAVGNPPLIGIVAILEAIGYYLFIVSIYKWNKRRNNQIRDDRLHGSRNGLQFLVSLLIVIGVLAAFTAVYARVVDSWDGPSQDALVVEEQNSTTTHSQLTEQEPQPKLYTYYTNAVGNLRSCPSTQCEVLGQTFYNAPVTASYASLEEMPEWTDFTITTDGGEKIKGYVHKSIFSKAPVVAEVKFTSEDEGNADLFYCRGEAWLPCPPGQSAVCPSSGEPYCQDEGVSVSTSPVTDTSSSGGSDITAEQMWILEAIRAEVAQMEAEQKQYEQQKAQYDDTRQAWEECTDEANEIAADYRDKSDAIQDEIDALMAPYGSLEMFIKRTLTDTPLKNEWHRLMTEKNFIMAEGNSLVEDQRNQCNVYYSLLTDTPYEYTSRSSDWYQRYYSNLQSPVSASNNLNCKITQREDGSIYTRCDGMDCRLTAGGGSYVQRTECTPW